MGLQVTWLGSWQSSYIAGYRYDLYARKCHLSKVSDSKILTQNMPTNVEVCIPTESTQLFCAATHTRQVWDFGGD
jgi:hypothetical protein